MNFEIFDVEIPMPARYEFIQPGEFEDPYYQVKVWSEEDQEHVPMGRLEFSEGRWSFEYYAEEYALDSWDLREIADKLDSLNEGVK